MKSEKKLFNKTIFITNIKRLWPITAMGAFLWLMSGISGWNNIISSYRIGQLNPERAKLLLLQQTEVSIPVYTFFLIGVLGLGVWNYLFSKRGMDFFHVLPMGKGELFVTNSISLFTMSVVSFVPGFVIYAIALMITEVHGGKELLLAILVSVGICFIFAAVSTLATVFSGNYAAQGALYVAFCTCFSYIEYIVVSFAAKFIYGVDYIEAGKITFLSPLIYIMEKINVRTHYSDDLDFVELTGFGYVFAYVAVSVVIFAISYVLYTKRKSEAAGEMVAFKIIKQAAMWILAFSGTIFVGEGIYSMLVMEFNNVVLLAPMIICIIVSSVICFYVAEMMVNGNFRVFTKKRVVPSLVFTLVMVCFTVVLSFDPFGVHKVVPEISEIESVNVWVSDIDKLFLSQEKDRELMTEFVNLHKMIIEEGPGYDKNDYQESFSVQYRYRLKDNTEINRYYRIPCSDITLMDEKNALDGKIQKLMNDNRVISREYCLDTPEDSYVYGYISGFKDEDDGYFSYTMSNEMLKEFREALMNDFLEGNLPGNKIIADENETGNITIEIQALVETGSVDDSYVPWMLKYENVSEGIQTGSETVYFLVYYREQMENVGKFLEEREIIQKTVN